MTSVKRRRIEKNDSQNELKIFRKKVVDFLCDNKTYRSFRSRCLKADFFDLLVEMKIKRILSNKSGVQGLKIALNNARFQYLRKLFEETFPNFSNSDTSTTMHVMAESLAIKFFGNEAEITNRDIEKTNLDSIVINDYRYVDFNGNELNIDTIMTILSYIEYDKYMLYKIGTVCKGFYISIISTWPSVSISSLNLRNVSLCVLRNVRELKIKNRNTKEKFFDSEIVRLFDIFSGGSNIRRLHFHCNFRTFRRLMNKFFKQVKALQEKGKSEFRHPFPKVVELSLRLLKPHFEGDEDLENCIKLSLKSEKKNVLVGQLKEVFPFLSHFQNPYFLPMLEGTKLSSLKIDRGLCHPLPSLRRIFSHPKYLKSFQMHVRRRWRKETFQYIKEFFSHLRFIRKLELSLCGFVYWGNIVGFFDFGFLTELNELDEFTLRLRELPEGHFNSYETNYWGRYNQWNLGFRKSTLVESLLSNNIIVNLRKLSILTEEFITSKDVFQLMSKKKEVSNSFPFLQHLRVLTGSSGSQSEIECFEEILQNIPNFEFIHLEFKNCNPDPHFIMIERNKTTKTLKISIFSVCTRTDLGMEKSDRRLSLAYPENGRTILDNLEYLLQGNNYDNSEDEVKTFHFITKKPERGFVWEEEIDEIFVNRFEKKILQNFNVLKLDIYRDLERRSKFWNRNEMEKYLGNVGYGNTFVNSFHPSSKCQECELVNQIYFRN